MVCDSSAKSAVSFGVAERRTMMEDLGRSGRTDPSAARVGESVKSSSMGETVGTWMTSGLVGVVGERYARALATTFKPVGVVYGRGLHVLKLNLVVAAPTPPVRLSALVKPSVFIAPRSPVPETAEEPVQDTTRLSRASESAPSKGHHRLSFPRLAQSAESRMTTGFSPRQSALKRSD